MEFLRHILTFFTDKSHSFSAKFIAAIIFILVLLFIDNIFGISFYYSTKLKLEQLQAIEQLRESNQNDVKLIAVLDETEEAIIERKNLLQLFGGLFSEVNLDGDNDQIQHSDTVYITRHDTVYLEKVVPKEEATGSHTEEVEESRSQLWHTVTSSYMLIMLLVIMPFIPFTDDSFSWSALLGVIFSLPFVAGLIWLNQFLFGLIPLILGKAWINYVVNAILHASTLAVLGFLSSKSKKRRKTS